MHIKDFDGWNHTKKQIHYDGKITFAHPREIRYIKLWLNIGYEEDGKDIQKWYIRPVLILSKVGNMYAILPMTTKWKENNRYYHRVSSIDFGKSSDIILSQIKSIDTKRLVEKIWMISKDEFSIIQKKIQQLYLLW